MQLEDYKVRILDSSSGTGAALVDRGVTRLIVGRKTGGAFGYLSIGDSGVPVLPGFTRPRAFTF